MYQILNSIKFMGSKDQKKFMRALKPVYRAETKELAELRLLELEEMWGRKYPKVLESW
nr:transposase [Pontibacter indicus]